MTEVDIMFQNYYLVGGYRFTKALEAEASKQPYRYLGRVLSDERIAEYNIAGRSLLELPDDSPAYMSVKKIMAKAGY